jgi:hypothetical protein
MLVHGVLLTRPSHIRGCLDCFKCNVGRSPHEANAVPEGNGTQGLQPLGMGGNATHLYLVALVHGKAMNVGACRELMR